MKGALGGKKKGFGIKLSLSARISLSIKLACLGALGMLLSKAQRSRSLVKGLFGKLGGPGEPCAHFLEAGSRVFQGLPPPSLPRAGKVSLSSPVKGFGRPLRGCRIRLGRTSLVEQYLRRLAKRLGRALRVRWLLEEERLSAPEKRASSEVRAFAGHDGKSAFRLGIILQLKSAERRVEPRLGRQCMRWIVLEEA